MHQIHPERNGRRSVLYWLLGVCIFGGAVGCRFWYPQAAEALQRVVFGRDGTAIEAAFSAFEECCWEEGDFARAVEVFCTDAGLPR